ncbi:hypothetical protein HMPREF1420_00601 [Helicobacter pylori GAM264Ai]|nr:hypothetical protein HMPREF1420_00601 [Helicobacter pylori GAM264Ai]
MELRMKLGKKLWEKEPSAKIRLNKLGNLKATKKISLYTPAPRILAIIKSRKKPKILEHKIPKLFVKNIFFSMSVAVIT